MQEKLIVYLHTKDIHHPSWIVMDAEGVILEKQYQGDALILASKAANRIVRVIVPAEEILCTQISLQKIPKSRLRQVLPYALEEQLIDEVEQLHFAVGVSAVDGCLPVAIVSHAKMKQWLKQIAAWGIYPHEMMSAIYLLAYEKNSWHMLSLDGLILVRTSLTQGFACDAIDLSILLNSAFAAEERNTPQQIISAIEDSSLLSLLNLSASIEIKKHTHHPEDFLVQATNSLQAAVPIDLLQGVYAVKRSAFFGMSNIAKTATYLVGIWLVCLLSYPFVSYWIPKQRMDDIDLQINQIYQYHFPHSENVIAPKLRMEDKLRKLKTQTNDQPLFTYLTDIGKGLLQTPNIKLKRIDYQQGQTIVELSANTSQDFSKFTDFLTQQGLAVKQQNANFIGSQMNATLLIE